MNKLYKIKVLHGAPRDSHKSIETYLVARSDEEVFEWIDNEKRYGYWSEDCETTYYDDKSEKYISFQEYVMLNKGDLEDENGWDDAYYGVIKYGWEEVENVSQEDIDVLLKLGIAKNMNSQILESFKARGWEFKIEVGYEVWFKSPRMIYGYSFLCDGKDIDRLTEADIKEFEIDIILSDWKSELKDQIHENVIRKMAQQYKLMMMKDINPPRSQKISFDVEFKV